MGHARIVTEGGADGDGGARREAGAVSACRLTVDLLCARVGGGSRDGLADVVAGGAVMVLPALWAPGPGMAGFRCAGRLADLRAEVAKPSPHPGGGQPLGRQGLLPWPAQVDCQVAGQA